LIEQGLTSPPTQYRLSGRQFYRPKDPTNSIKVLKEISPRSSSVCAAVLWCNVCVMSIDSDNCAVVDESTSDS